MLKWLKKIAKVFTPNEPTHLELAVKELESARRELLSAQSQKELFENDAAYHRQRISRLNAYLTTHENQAKDE